MGASYVARSFSGDKKQLVPLIKGAIRHNGSAILDIISPCVTFNNQDNAAHSYAWGKEHEVALHDLSYVPPAKEIMVDYEDGQIKEVTMHDGSTVILKKLERDYNPKDRAEAMRVLEESNKECCLITGLIYIDESEETLFEHYNLPDEPLNRLSEDRLRPSRDTIDQLNALMF
jgi:2-oxoglutarate ferredoxin oxidoreductase subunit beta